MHHHHRSSEFLRALRQLRLSALASLLFTTPAPAQTDSTYHLPSAPLVAVVDAPLTPTIRVSPDKKNLLLCERPPLPPLAELARPELRLAGLRIDPATNSPSRESYFTGLLVSRLEGGALERITGLPAGARLGDVSWSRDSRHVAFTVTAERAVELWVADMATTKARRLTERPLNTLMDTPSWVDAETLVVSFVPAGRAAPPAAPTVPAGPVIQENLGGKRPSRTYPDLLASAYDEALFDHYAFSEAALVSLAGNVTPLGLRGIFAGIGPSPDGRYLLVSTISRPYSYLVPASRFPTKTTVHTRDGKLVATIADLPLAENIPIPTNSVRTGPRSISWRADAPATLSWFEALDGGDAGHDAELRDEWFLLPAPFMAPKISLQKFALRANGVTWGDDHRALVSEGWWKTRKTRTWLIDPAAPGATPILLEDRSTEDRYRDPGSPILTQHANGRSVLTFSSDRSKIYLRGDGASPEGNRPFVDEFDLATKTATRLWRSNKPFYETFIAFADDTHTRAITQRESAKEPPSIYLRNFALGDDAKAAELAVYFPDPFPEFTSIIKKRINYKRADGVALSGTLLTPPGWKENDPPLPTLLWAYPREFKDADAAGQIRGSPYQFTRVSPSGALPFVLAGYAVLDDPAMPIIGEGAKEPNDTYIPQLVADAQAAIDELVRRGVTDRRRVAIAGHSYGAFMTANLLAHSDLFRAGIARSGAYNRTLTPFGFQSEERTLWQAPEVYSAMAPFNHADKIKAPLLLIHGMADNNQGTFPMQSERFYNALKGHGAITRYVQLPYEAHGYRARENILHMLWEMETWLNTYVKPLPKE